MALFFAGILYFLIHRDAVKKFLVWQVFQLIKAPSKKQNNNKKDIKIMPSNQESPALPAKIDEEQEKFQEKIEADRGFNVKVVSKEVLEDAWDTIGNTLDVVSISRDLCALRSIMRILLDQNQKVRLTRVNINN